MKPKTMKKAAYLKLYINVIVILLRYQHADHGLRLKKNNRMHLTVFYFKKGRRCAVGGSLCLIKVLIVFQTIIFTVKKEYSQSQKGVRNC